MLGSPMKCIVLHIHSKLLDTPNGQLGGGIVWKLLIRAATLGVEYKWIS